ncbi:hypothetical protein [Chitinophaga silvisoli]|uniref:Uncharacterized protein n=1 Tax=Chitinophaga silvisoli TaxID=2291814 RepID=A0A3E1P7H2_9BACT|nr:hypothetical protein [Chitinophaga silvisoli]RFM36040.1 hypothetical protein DXN04_00555 [Chitinophaga silvisoli]
MLKNPTFSIWLVSIYLLVHLALLSTGLTVPIMLISLILSPFLVIWMVFTILKYGKYKSRKLSYNEPDIL